MGPAFSRPEVVSAGLFVWVREHAFHRQVERTLTHSWDVVLGRNLQKQLLHPRLPRFRWCFFILC
jgi:hypothetical protein